MSEQQTWLEEAQARCDAATPGPWYHCEWDRWATSHISTLDRRHCGVWLHRDKVGYLKRDNEFIAHARTDLPRALDRIRELEKQLEEARAAFWKYGGHMYDCRMTQQRTGRKVCKCGWERALANIPLPTTGESVGGGEVGEVGE